MAARGPGLARLTAAGFPVPAWFIIATDRYRDYVARQRAGPDDHRGPGGAGRRRPRRPGIRLGDDPGRLHRRQLARTGLGAGARPGRGVDGHPAGGPVVGDRGGPAGGFVRRAAGHVSERDRGGCAARGRGCLLRQSLDGPRDRLPAAQRCRPDPGGAGCGRPGDGPRRDQRGAVHREPADGSPCRERDRCHLRVGRGAGLRTGRAGSLGGRDRRWPDPGTSAGRQAGGHRRDAWRRRAAG